MIKCIVCDLDGTLIRMNDTMNLCNQEMLHYCIKNGIQFMIATGRDLNMVVDILDEYQLDCNLILNNGTEYRNRDGSIQEVYPMDAEGFIQIVNLLKKYGYTVEIFTDQGLYGLYDQDTFWDMHYKMLVEANGYIEGNMPRKCFTTKELFLRHYHQVSTPEEVLQEAKPLKIDARHANDTSIGDIREELNQIMNLNISSSHDHMIEITGTDSTKGDMLIDIVSRLGFSRDEVAVFGDAENDLSMMKAFKYSIAPSNACQEVKEAAYYVTNNNCDDGAVGEGLQYLQSLGLIK